MLLFCAAVSFAGRLLRPQPAAPLACSCRTLLADPEFYDGKSVRLSTAGMQPGADPRELVYRPLAGGPPAVVCRFAEPPDGIPAFLVGVARGGKPVRVEDCKPD